MLAGPRKQEQYRPMDNNKVFINCPYDDEYSSFFRMIIFFCYYFRCEPCFASENVDASSRKDKIIDMIKSCCFSIHDISRVEIAKNTNLPRFNMPFELGLDVMYRNDSNLKNNILILDGKEKDYEKALSDLKGSDIEAHMNKELKLATILRKFFITKFNLNNANSPTKILNEFKCSFYTWFYEEKSKQGFCDEDIMDMCEYKLKVKKFFDETDMIVRPNPSVY